ncbi:hypothetical protein, partial [Halolamina salina]
MRIVDDGRVVGDGRALDLRGEPYSPATVRAAVRGEGAALSIDCPTPSRWWEWLAGPVAGNGE